MSRRGARIGVTTATEEERRKAQLEVLALAQQQVAPTAVNAPPANARIRQVVPVVQTAEERRKEEVLKAQLEVLALAQQQVAPTAVNAPPANARIRQVVPVVQTAEERRKEEVLKAQLEIMALSQQTVVAPNKEKNNAATSVEEKALEEFLASYNKLPIAEVHEKTNYKVSGIIKNNAGIVKNSFSSDYSLYKAAACEFISLLPDNATAAAITTLADYYHDNNATNQFNQVRLGDRNGFVIAGTNFHTNLGKYEDVHLGSIQDRKTSQAIFLSLLVGMLKYQDTLPVDEEEDVKTKAGTIAQEEILKFEEELHRKLLIIYNARPYISAVQSETRKLAVLYGYQFARDGKHEALGKAKDEKEANTQTNAPPIPPVAVPEFTKLFAERGFTEQNSTPEYVVQVLNQKLKKEDELPADAIAKRTSYIPANSNGDILNNSLVISDAFGSEYSPYYGAATEFIAALPTGITAQGIVTLIDSYYSENLTAQAEALLAGMDGDKRATFETQRTNFRNGAMKMTTYNDVQFGPIDETKTTQAIFASLVVGMIKHSEKIFGESEDVNEKAAKTNAQSVKPEELAALEKSLNKHLLRTYRNLEAEDRRINPWGIARTQEEVVTKKSAQTEIGKLAVLYGHQFARDGEYKALGTARQEEVPTPNQAVAPAGSTSIISMIRRGLGL